ncbi:hypothetical protein EVAR_8752_1 [Eumeta japonica]|uniref:Uncharacterized protein n=1 Tax=Eumeta variegata TaxID=151549 RepID=A0A4C1TU09_EUMVA|nr:hypothetical protein EVAR_8752_1 [Eumeta japonica]
MEERRIYGSSVIEGSARGALESVRCVQRGQLTSEGCLGERPAVPAAPAAPVAPDDHTRREPCARYDQRGHSLAALLLESLSSSIPVHTTPAPPYPLY